MKYQIIITTSDKPFFITFQNLDLAKHFYELMLLGFKDVDGDYIELQVVNIIRSSRSDQ